MAAGRLLAVLRAVLARDRLRLVSELMLVHGCLRRVRELVPLPEHRRQVGRAVSTGDERVGAGGLHDDDARGDAAFARQPQVLGTRPEHLRLASEGGIASRVVVMEPTGADTFVACRHGSTEVAAVFRERHEFAPGSTIHLMPDLARAHLFDAASGERLAA